MCEYLPQDLLRSALHILLTYTRAPTCERQSLAGKQPVQAPEARPAAVLVEGLHVGAANALLRRGPHDLGEEVLQSATRRRSVVFV